MGGDVTRIEVDGDMDMDVDVDVLKGCSIYAKSGSNSKSDVELGQDAVLELEILEILEFDEFCVEFKNEVKLGISVV